MLESMDVQVKHPFSMLIAGSRGVGKTMFATNLLKNVQHIMTPIPNHIVWCYAKHQVWCYAKHQPELYRQLKDIDEKIEYIEGIPSELNEMFDQEKVNMLILDDMMDEASGDKRIEQLFTRGRHDNLSIIYLTQNLFHKKQRNISLNSDYMVIFKTARDQTQFTNLARQLMPANIKFLMSAYKDATKLPHSYLMLDLKAATNDKHRIRTNILEAPQYVYIPYTV